MTKYEWESELKKNIHRLPDDEIARVLDFYEELFADKIESGRSERDIIAEFGNPVDVADKILAEFDGDLKSETGNTVRILPPPSGEYRRDAISASPPNELLTPPRNRTSPIVQQPERVSAQPVQAAKPQVAKGKVSGGRVVGFVLFLIFLGWLPFTIIVTLWSVVLSFGAAGIGCTVGGIVGCVPSAIMLFESVPVGMVQFACCAGAIGAGLLFIALTVGLCKLFVKATKAILVGLARWISPKKEAL